MRAAVIALTEPTALRSMHGICTSPPTGSQVRPRLCSMPISAAFSTCSGVPPRTSARPAAAMEQAEPTSPLAAHFRAGDGRVLLEQQPDSPGGQHEADHPDLVLGADEVPVVVQDSRNDAGRPVGR